MSFNAVSDKEQRVIKAAKALRNNIKYTTEEFGAHMAYMKTEQHVHWSVAAWNLKRALDDLECQPTDLEAELD